MRSTNEIAKVYETVLSVPGMTENVKIELKMTRKTVFLLAKIIERGLSPKDIEGSHILNAVGESALEEIRTTPEELLQKAGLKEMNEKLKEL